MLRILVLVGALLTATRCDDAVRATLGARTLIYAGQVERFCAGQRSPHILQPSQWTASTDLYTNQLLVGDLTYWALTAQKPWSLSNPSGETLRFEVRPGDVWLQGDGTITPEKNRSELAGTTHYAVGTDIHISYGWTVEPGARNTAKWLSTGQLRQTANDHFSAPFAIMLNGERMRISIETGGVDPSWRNFRNLYLDSRDIVRGHAYQMQINARFDAVHGHLDVIRDGVTLVHYDGPLGWATMGSVYWKEGVYRERAPEAIAMDYSHLSITTGDAGAGGDVRGSRQAVARSP